MTSTMRKYFDSILVSRSFLAVFCCLGLLGCVEKTGELESGDNFVITNQNDVESFTSEGKDIHTLTIEGSDVTDLTDLDIKSAKIINIRNTGIKKLAIKKLSAVQIALNIEGNNELETIADWDIFKFMLGTIRIDNNPKLTDISALMTLKVYNGNLEISGNKSLGENKVGEEDSFGFNVIRYLLDNDILKGEVKLSNNHPAAATDIDDIGVTPGGSRRYIIASDGAANSFKSMDIVPYLHLKGTLTDRGITTLASKMKVVDTLIFDAGGVTNADKFFGNVDFNGDVTFTSAAKCTFPKFKSGTVIGGNFVIEEGCQMNTQVDAGAIVEIKGDFSVKGIKLSWGGFVFNKLEKVGGNFTYVGLTDAWTFNEMTKLREIGGNLTIMNCDIHGLWGFDKLTRIGGNVTISHNTDIALEGTNSGGAAGNPGFCRIRYYMDAGIISPDAAVTLGDAGGSVIDPEILTACAPGN